MQENTSPQPEKEPFNPAQSFESYLQHTFPFLTENHWPADHPNGILRSVKDVLHQRFTPNQLLTEEHVNALKGTILFLYARNEQIHSEPIKAEHLTTLTMIARNVWPIWETELPLFVEATQDLGYVPEETEMMISRIRKYFVTSETLEDFRDAFLPPNPFNNPAIEAYRDYMWESAMALIRNLIQQPKSIPPVSDALVVDTASTNPGRTKRLLSMPEKDHARRNRIQRRIQQHNHGQPRSRNKKY